MWTKYQVYLIYVAKIIKHEHEVMAIQRRLKIAVGLCFKCVCVCLRYVRACVRACLRCVYVCSRQGYTDTFFSVVLARLQIHAKMSFFYAHFVCPCNAQLQYKHSKFETKYELSFLSLKTISVFRQAQKH